MNRQQLKLLAVLPLLVILVLADQWDAAFTLVAVSLYMGYKLDPHPTLRRWAIISIVSLLIFFLTTIRITSDDNRGLRQVRAAGIEVI